MIGVGEDQNNRTKSKTKNGSLALRYGGMQPSTSYTSSLSSSAVSSNINPEAFASAASTLWGTSSPNLPINSIVAINQLSARSSPNNVHGNNVHPIPHPIMLINNHSSNSLNNATRFDKF